MGSNVPKQFLLLDNQPVLMHTMANFEKALDALSSEEAMNEGIVNNIVNNFVVVLPPQHIKRWTELCAKYNFEIPHTIVIGGENRFESVRNGLKDFKSGDYDLIAVHDGVRPFVTSAMLRQGLDTAYTMGSAIPIVPMVDSIRNAQHTLPRENFFTVQTPQIFTSRLIQKAYNQQYKPTFTDDASVVESLKLNTSTYPGDENNIKITTPLDLQIAEIIVTLG